jgi:dipeptidase
VPCNTLLRFACDSLVALGNSTRDGDVLFAKNSDRPAFECQPLVQLPARRGLSGQRVRCTYIDIPQAVGTARVIGSKPFWCWGFEHGLNEHGVAIGNHTVFTKDELGPKGLIGMDIVRLGLERGTTARAALEEMTRLIETHGQGGSGYHDKEWPYHNSFLLADRSEAYLLETSDKRWAVRQIDDVGSASNHLTIGSDWTALSDGVIEHAIDRGWWAMEASSRFDFATAYRDTALVPEVVSSGRHRQTCRLLEEQRGTVGVDSLRRALRDHYGLSAPGAGQTPMDPEYFSICMHADPVGTTTASMIASLPASQALPPLYLASLGSPCVGAFVPLFVDAEVPAILSRGAAEPDDESPWWQLKHLLVDIERDWERNAPRVRAEMDRFETEAYGAARAAAGSTASAKSELMRQIVADLLGLARRLRRELGG